MAHAQGFLLGGVQPLALGSLEVVSVAEGSFDVTPHDRERCAQLMRYRLKKLPLLIIQCFQGQLIALQLLGLGPNNFFKTTFFNKALKKFFNIINYYIFG